MRFICLASILLGMVTFSLPAADVSPVDMQLEVTDRRYCRGDAEVGFLRLKLRCILRNAGEKPVLLSRGSMPTQYVMLADSEEAFREQRYRLTFHTTVITALAVAWKGNVEDAAVFLRSGDAHVTESEALVPLTIPLGRATSPGPGEYWLGIVVETWPFLKPPPEEWARQGGAVVFTGAVRSRPLKIRVDPPRVRPVQVRLPPGPSAGLSSAMTLPTWAR